MTARGIYLDLVPDLSRYINDYSDCGTNLKGAKSELQETLNEIKHEVLHRECGKHQIEWHYNPPASPHMRVVGREW